MVPVSNVGRVRVWIQCWMYGEEMEYGFVGTVLVLGGGEIPFLGI